MKCDGDEEKWAFNRRIGAGDRVKRPNDSCSSADEIAQQQLAEVEPRIERLTSLKQELERMIAQCHTGKIGSCNVIQVLANHSNCLSTSHSAGHSAFGEGMQLSDTQRAHR